VLNLLIGLLGFYYLLPAGPALWRRARRLIPFSSSGADRLAERFTSITRAALLSIVATALSQGLTVGLGFLLVGLPNPLFWGVVTGVVSILPIFGSALIWVPGAAVLFLDGRMGPAITLGIIGFVISSNVDNLILPIIYRRVSGMHPMTSLLGAFAGVKLLGIFGLLLGPLALTYCFELYSLYEAEYGTTDANGGAPRS
jgi:predicted PurR-regulated permease PerM